LKRYVLDACALLAVLAGENGADNVKNIFREAVNRQAFLVMHKINFLEVYYRIYKIYGRIEADDLLKKMEQKPILIKAAITDDLLREAGRLKSKYRLSLADSIAVSESIIGKGSLVTADYHEIKPIEIAEKIDVTWFR